MMAIRRLIQTLAVALLILVVAGCSDDRDAEPDPGITRAEVEAIVEDAVGTAVANIPQPEPRLSPAEVQDIVRDVMASIPSKSAPADYTKFFVDSAIGRYRTQGADAALDYYNSEDSIDGQWYVFIVDENDLVIGHPDPQRLGLDLKGWVGTDANGYNFGAEMLSATEEGKWVSYVYKNPDNSAVGADFALLELKNAWVVRHDGLLFGSGWYISAEEFTKRLVSVAVDTFRSGGLEATVQYFAQPESALAGLETAIGYYNSAETVDGVWFAFISDDSGRIMAHSQPPIIGMELETVFGDRLSEVDSDGVWVANEGLRVWVVEHEGWIFGAGWQR